MPATSRSMPTIVLRAATAAILCWGALSSLASPETPSAGRITVKNFMFMPTSLTVKAGNTVTWENLDEEPHTVVSDTGLFRSAAIDTKDSFSYKFAAPGTYHFTCSMHPRMVGTIVVE
jgi:plastocyanin